MVKAPCTIQITTKENIGTGGYILFSSSHGIRHDKKRSDKKVSSTLKNRRLL